VKVVLLHAFPLDERMWAPQRPALEGHEVVAPNLYELGGNSIDGWAERILGDIDDDVVVVGASMGGYVALALVRLAPERVRAVLLAGARPNADSPERRAGRAATIELIEEQGAAGVWENQSEKLFGEQAPADAVELARQMALSRDQDELRRGIEAIRDRPDSTDVLQSHPVVFALGATDVYFPVDEARVFAEASPRARLAVFERSRHLPSLEQPDEFNELLSEFLQAAQ
jgi:pimeloyl-ACP methyl ester carboxylesterase